MLEHAKVNAMMHTPVSKQVLTCRLTWTFTWHEQINNKRQYWTFADMLQDTTHLSLEVKQTWESAAAAASVVSWAAGRAASSPVTLWRQHTFQLSGLSPRPTKLVPSPSATHSCACLDEVYFQSLLLLFVFHVCLSLMYLSWYTDTAT